QHGTDERRTLSPDDLEVAILDRTRPRRLFHRLEGDDLADLLRSA
ncbi:MAG TPA: proteasome subunit alpha, partial [Actinobacteria bacterium]|nr:proteasome subunit alpha [Actinomycetota bacterium]